MIPNRSEEGLVQLRISGNEATAEHVAEEIGPWEQANSHGFLLCISYNGATRCGHSESKPMLSSSVIQTRTAVAQGQKGQHRTESL